MSAVFRGLARESHVVTKVAVWGINAWTGHTYSLPITTTLTAEAASTRDVCSEYLIEFARTQQAGTLSPNELHDRLIVLLNMRPSLVEAIELPGLAADAGLTSRPCAPTQSTATGRGRRTVRVGHECNAYLDTINAAINHRGQL